jgi:hypothetical protein
MVIKVPRLFVAILLITGCTYDNEQDLYPDLLCDTLDVTYSGKIVPILESNCYPCHSNANAPIYASNLSFEGYANISGYLNLGSGNGAARFVSIINHEAGFPQMPKNGPKLPKCTIRKFEIWIANGYPDN